jgi:hypothetical protein
LNTKLSGLVRSGTWTSSWPEQKGKFRLLNLRNGGKRLTIVPSCTRKEQKGGTFIVLLLNSCVHLSGHGKLHSKWEGPYLVLHTVDHDAINLQCDHGDTLKVNDQRLKLFLEPNPQNFEVVDVLDLLEIE